MELFGKTYSAGEITYWIVMAACLITLAVMLIRAYITYFRSSSTRGRVHGILRKLGVLRSWSVLRDVTVAADGQSAHLDHAVVGPWGVLLFCDITERGYYYGSMEEDRWARTDGEEEKAVNRVTVANPGMECRKAESILRKLFAREGIYNVSVEWFVPTTGKHVKSFITGGSGKVLAPSELREVLSRGKYDKDNGVDIPRISALFQP